MIAPMAFLMKGTAVPKDHAPAILRWREYVAKLYGGLDAFDQSSTISTMLFGCDRWLEEYGASEQDDTRERIKTIRAELEAWMGQRGLTIY